MRAGRGLTLAVEWAETPCARRRRGQGPRGGRRWRCSACLNLGACTPTAGPGPGGDLARGQRSERRDAARAARPRPALPEPRQRAAPAGAAFARGRGRRSPPPWPRTAAGRATRWRLRDGARRRGASAGAAAGMAAGPPPRPALAAAPPVPWTEAPPAAAARGGGAAAPTRPRRARGGARCAAADRGPFRRLRARARARARPALPEVPDAAPAPPPPDLLGAPPPAFARPARAAGRAAPLTARRFSSIGGDPPRSGRRRPPTLHRTPASMTEEFHRIRRLPPYVFAEVNAAKAERAGGGRGHRGPRHGQPGQPDAAAHRGQAGRGGAGPAHAPLLHLARASPGCGGRWPATTRAASA